MDPAPDRRGVGVRGEGGTIESVFLAQIDSARHDVEHIWSFLGRALYSAAKLVTVGENILIWSDDASRGMRAPRAPLSALLFSNRAHSL